MKIAMLTYSTKPRGGVVHALSLSEALIDLGQDVKLFSLRKKGEDVYPDGFFRSTRVPFEIYDFEPTGKTVEDVKRMIAVYAENLPLDFQVYHSQDCVGANALYELRKSGRLNAMTVRTVHHVDEFRGRTLTRFQEKSISLLDVKIVVSKYWQQILEKVYGVRSHVVHNGIDLDRFSRQGDVKTGCQGRSILYVGGLEARKGVEFLLLALELVKAQIPDVKLTIIGRSGLTGGESYNERDMFGNLARRIGIEKNIVFEDFVTEEKLMQYYGDCDVFVLPSRMEGWGLVLMEAMAFKKPVVASNVGGVPELVEHDRNGLLVEPGDVKGIAESIVKLLRDRNLSSRLGKAGRRKVKGFSWDRTARRTLEIYERSLEET